MSGTRPVGVVIARARQRKRWTQVELAKRLGVHELTVVAWETGRIKYPKRHIGAIEKELEIDLSKYDKAS